MAILTQEERKLLIDIFGVKDEAQVKKVYRKLALKFHPNGMVYNSDHNSNNDQQEAFKLIDRAYKLLKNDTNISQQGAIALINKLRNDPATISLAKFIKQHLPNEQDDLQTAVSIIPYLKQDLLVNPLATQEVTLLNSPILLNIFNQGNNQDLLVNPLKTQEITPFNPKTLLNGFNQGNNQDQFEDALQEEFFKALPLIISNKIKNLLEKDKRLKAIINGMRDDAIQALANDIKAYPRTYSLMTNEQLSARITKILKEYPSYTRVSFKI